MKERVKKEKKEEEKKDHFINYRVHARRALAKNLKNKKYVEVGGKKDK